MSRVVVPPPSPIPTGKGSRSAASESLEEFLDKSSKVPDLTLPEPHHLPNVRHQTPREINYRLLKSRDYASVDRLLRSARELGAFRISYHGISSEELRSFVKETDRAFTVLEQTNIGFQQIPWIRSGNGTIQMQSPRKCLDYDKYPDFSEKMEDVVCKLDAIAQLLCKIFIENMERKCSLKKLQDKEYVISLSKHSHENKKELNTHFRNEIDDDHALCLYFPSRKSQFLVQSEKGRFCFDTGPDTIVVTVGKLLEEWSLKDFQCASGLIIPHLQVSQMAFSVELKCWSLNAEDKSNKSDSTISIRDQILIALVIVFLYDTYGFLYSSFVFGTS